MSVSTPHSVHEYPLWRVAFGLGKLGLLLVFLPLVHLGAAFTSREAYPYMRPVAVFIVLAAGALFFVVLRRSWNRLRIECHPAGLLIHLGSVHYRMRWEHITSYKVTPQFGGDVLFSVTQSLIRRHTRDGLLRFTDGLEGVEFQIQAVDGSWVNFDSGISGFRALAETVLDQVDPGFTLQSLRLLAQGQTVSFGLCELSSEAVRLKNGATFPVASITEVRAVDGVVRILADGSWRELGPVHNAYTLGATLRTLIAQRAAPGEGQAPSPATA